MPIIHGTRIEKPLPHLVYAIVPENMDIIKRGFLTMCGIDSYTAGSACEPHFHDCHEYWLILEGKARAQVGTVEEEVALGDIILTPIGAEHQFSAVTDATVLWCYGPLKGQKRVGHIHKATDPPSAAAQPFDYAPIVRHRRLEKPLPHLAYALQPVNFDVIKKGFLTMCGWDYYAAGSQCDLHYHDCDEYWFILDGKAIARCGDEQGEVRHGDVVFTPRGTKQQFTALTNVCMLWMYGELKGKKRVGHVHDGDK